MIMKSTIAQLAEEEVAELAGESGKNLVKKGKVIVHYFYILRAAKIC